MWKPAGRTDRDSHVQSPELRRGLVAAATAAAAEPPRTQGLPRVSDDQSTHTAKCWKNAEYSTADSVSLVLHFSFMVSCLTITIALIIEGPGKGPF